MSAKVPFPASQVINLLSSSPLQQPTEATDGPLMSSPLLPSLKVMLRQFNAEKVATAPTKTKQVEKDKTERPSTWSVPDDVGEEDLPPARKKRVTKTTDSAAARKPRVSRKTVGSSKVEKKAPLNGRKLKGGVVKSVEMQSKHFPRGQPGKETTSRLAIGDQEFPQDASDLLDTTPKNYAIVPESPRKQPELNQPLHITRRQWTPVKDTVLSLDSSSPLMGEPRKSKRSIFDDIVGVMRYSTNSLQSSREVSANKENPIGNGLRNKRSIEVIGYSSAVTVTKEKPPKLPKPKKKARTITGQATTQFCLAGGSIDPIQVCFAMNEGERTDPQKIPRKPGPPAKKKRKSSPEVIILLSPTSARERFDDQDFVFGTCSQLEGVGGDEACDNQMGVDDGQDDLILSPPSTSVARRDYLKTLAKERKGGRTFGECNAENDKMGPRYDNYVNAATNCAQEQFHQDARQKGSQLGKIRKTAGRLWDAAARDAGGELMSIETADMTGSDNGCLESGLSRDRNVTTGSNLTGRSAAQNEHLLVGMAACESNQVQTLGISRDISHSIIPRPQSATIPPAKSAESADSVTACLSTGTRTKVSTTSEQTKFVPVMPDFRSYPTTTLKVEVAKFGFKDMKTRDRMVSCLEKCWEAKNKAATAQSTPQQAEVNARPVENTAELPKQGSNGEEAELVLQEALSEIVAKGKKFTKWKSKSPKRKFSKSKKSSTVSSHDDDDSLGVADPPAKPSPRKPASTPKSQARKSASPKGQARKSASPKGQVRKSASPKRQVRKSTSPKPQVRRFASPKFRARRSTSPKFRAGENPRNRKDFTAVCGRISEVVLLEEVTLWLNTKEELKGLRIDEEMVKAWCDANGVCCIRNTNSLGRERKRFS